MRRLLRAGALSVAVVLAATGCGGGGGSGEKVVKVGMIAPITGDLAAFAQGMRKTAALAIKQANAADTVKGWKIVFDPQDDHKDAKQGANVAQRLASDDSTVAVIGTLNSSVALAVQPILGAANIAMVSPANTDVSLTQGLKWRTDPKRAYDNYFRVVTNDAAQGGVAAKYAYNELKRRKAVVIHDKKTYGQGLATIFADDFAKLGGTVETTLQVNPGEGDYKSTVTTAKAKDPDIIFYGGEYPEAGVIAKNMGELGMEPPDVVLLGGDGIVDKTFVKLGGANAQGQYATTVGADATYLDSAKGFVDAYKKAYNAEDYAIYGPPTWDAANVIIAALAKVLAGKDEIDDSVKKEIIAEIAKTDYKGALGTTTFDKYGDTTNKILTINKVEGDDFKPLAKLTVD